MYHNLKINSSSFCKRHILIYFNTIIYKNVCFAFSYKLWLKFVRTRAAFILTIRLYPRLSWRLHASRAEVPSRYSTAGIRKERTGACGSHLGRNVHRNCYVRLNLTAILLTRAMPGMHFSPRPRLRFLTRVSCRRSRCFECHSQLHIESCRVTCARARCCATPSARASRKARVYAMLLAIVSSN